MRQINDTLTGGRVGQGGSQRSRRRINRRRDMTGAGELDRRQPAMELCRLCLAPGSSYDPDLLGDLEQLG